MSDMDCRSVRDLADSFVAEELLTETNHDILRHLDACPVCRADVAERRRLRAAVRAAFDGAGDLAPRPEFVAQLRSTLYESAVRPAARRAAWRWLAVAAAVVIVAGAGVIVRGRMTFAALAQAAVGDHKNCALHFRLAERPIPLEEAARRYGAVYNVLDRLPPADVNTARGAARVLERHACVYDGRRFAHVVLLYRGERISLLMSPDAAAPVWTKTGHVDGQTVVPFRAGGRVLFVVGDVRADDLTELARAMEVSLDREMAGV